MPLIIRTIFYDSHSLDTSGHRLSQHWSIETYAKAVMKNPRDCFKAFDDFHLHCEGCSHNIYEMRGSAIVALWNEERSKYYYRLLTEMTATEYDTYLEKLRDVREELQNNGIIQGQPVSVWDEEDVEDTSVPEFFVPQDGRYTPEGFGQYLENRSASRRAAVLDTTSTTGADGITITYTRSTFGRSPLRGYSYSVGVDPSVCMTTAPYSEEEIARAINSEELDPMRTGSAPDGGF